MMRHGMMLFDEIEQIWRNWIGHEAYETYTRMNFEIYIQNRYYQALFEINYNDWFVTIEDEVPFV